MLATTAAMIEQFNKNNILILEELGYEVHAAGNWLEGNPISEERLEAFKLWLSEHHGKWFQIPSTRKPTDIKSNYAAYKRVLELIHKYRYEFIHCHTPIGAVIGRTAAHFTHTRIVYTAHGFHFYDGAPLKNWLFYYPVEKFLSRWTDVLITINNEDYRRAKEKFHMKRLEKIPGVGVDLDRYGCIGITKEEKRKELGISEDTVVLLSVGELIERKNHGVVIKAIAKLKEQSSVTVEYLIAGKGVLEEGYRKLISELGLEDEVKLIGFRDDISELCEASDIFLLPSLQEGLSVALMEAMASGLPCIVSDIRGNSDLITDGGGGFCIDYRDVNEWAEKIALLASDKKMQKEMAEVNRKRIKGYSIEKIGELIQTNIYSGGGVKHLQKIVLAGRAGQLRKELDIKNSDLVLISVGELNRNKNHEVVIKALAQLHNPEMRYVICGQGELKNYLEQLAEKLGVGNCVKLLGYRSDIPELLAMADVFVFPSKREGLPVALIEAMASGLPCIVCDNRGSRELIKDGACRYVIENPHDCSTIAKLVSQLKSNYIVNGMCRIKVKNTIFSFSKVAVNRQMMEIYGAQIR